MQLIPLIFMPKKLYNNYYVLILIFNPRFDLCLIIAPAVTFKGDTIVCGSAIEVNCITDIELTINLDQIKLISTLNNEFITFLSGSFEKIDDKNSCNNIDQRFSSGTQSIKPINWLKQTSDDSDIDFTKDSGVDFEMSSMHSTIIVSYQ
jgi:vacuolar protein sorting-associated protein 13B